MLRMFYESVVVPPVCSYMLGSRLKVADHNRLNKLIWKASDVVDEEMDSVSFT